MVLRPIGHNPAENTAFELPMCGLYIAFKFDTLTLDLKKHARFLRVERGTRFVFQGTDLADQLPDTFIHRNSCCRMR